MFSFFTSNSLSPEWTYRSESIIWRLVLAGQGMLIGECRDPERKATTFFCVNSLNGKVLWNDLRLDERWWVGIEAVHKGVLLLHGFAKPDMPEHKGLRAIDAASGVELWHDDSVAYWFAHGDRIAAYRDFFERRVGYEIDIQSGAILKTHDASLEELHKLRLQPAGEPSDRDVALPEVLVEGQADPEVVSLVEKESKGRSHSGRVEYYLSDNILLFNIHFEKRDGGGNVRLENTLFVCRLPQKKRLFAEVIGRNLKGYVPDSFFVRHPFVFFVKDQRILTAIRPWKL